MRLHAVRKKASSKVTLPITGMRYFYALDGGLTDELGLATTLTNNNSGTFTAGPGGVGLAYTAFDGNNQFPDAPDSGQFDLLVTQYTIGCRILLNGPSMPSDQGVIQRGDTAHKIWIESGTGNPYPRVMHNNTIFSANNSNLYLTLDQWAFLTIKFDANADTLKFRLNMGTEVTLTGVTTNPVDSTQAFEIGRQFANDLDGKICDVFCASALWDDADLSKLYNGGTRLLAADRQWA